VITSWFTAHLYDLIQRLAGTKHLEKLFRFELNSLDNPGWVLDIGGGTGLYRSSLPFSCHYICLDSDPRKLHGLRRRYPKERAIQGNAVRLPFPESSFDLCLLIFVAHHLDSAALGSTLIEVSRILKPSGLLFVADPLWEPNNLLGRFLWRLDRGSFPRNSQSLSELLQAQMRLHHKRRIRLFHNYEFFWCGPKK